MTERLHKVIANAGLASRRRAEQLISVGRVTVDGETATIGQRVDRETVAIEVDGIPLPVRPDLVYLLAYKPVGVVSTASDPQGRPTVVQLAPTGQRVYPVGRLDTDSEGLLLLTNDGDLTFRITHPSTELPKTYSVLVAGGVTGRSARMLVEGVELDDGPSRAASARVVDRRPDRSLLEIVMTHGRKREIRRMCDAIGHPVWRLVRTAIGPLRDQALAAGDVRSLTLDEVRMLYAAAGRPAEASPQEGP
ncbi:MAG: pseudouridine synthase [Acidimicrobiia bacterium]